MSVVIINGSATVGKDKMVELCADSHLKPIYNISTVDRVKQVAKELGWNGVKDEKGRKFLSELKALADKHVDHSMGYVINRHETISKSLSETGLTKKDFVMFVHCRESKNIGKIKNFFEALNIDTCKTLLIRRDSVEHITSNDSDKYVEDYDYDYIIENNGTIEDLRLKAIDFIKCLDNK